jgi:hypothetical protein
MTPEISLRLGARLAAAALCSATPLAGSAYSGGGGPVAAAPGEVRQWHFIVLLDGREIGSHDFTVSGGTGQTEVDSHASFKVSALAIPLYRYEHHDQESWRGGCLSRIDAWTRDNGHEYSVHGQSSRDAFEVHGPQGPAALHGCISSFAYWDPAVLLHAQRLLNTQNGEYQPVEVTALAPQSILAAGVPTAATHYRLSSPKFSIELWYSAAGRWLGLQTRAEGGRTVRYELRQQ